MDIGNTHKIELLGRRELKVYGVLDVHSFNENGILLETNMGILTVGGRELSISLLDLESSQVVLRGEIESLCYSEDNSASERVGGLLSRLFR